MGTDTPQRCDKRSETPKPRIAKGFGLNKGGGTEIRTQERRQPLAVFKTRRSWLTMRFDGATRQTARQSLLDNRSADPPTAARDRLRPLVSAERGVCENENHGEGEDNVLARRGRAAPDGGCRRRLGPRRVGGGRRRTSPLPRARGHRSGLGPQRGERARPRRDARPRPRRTAEFRTARSSPAA